MTTKYLHESLEESASLWLVSIHHVECKTSHTRSIHTRECVAWSRNIHTVLHYTDNIHMQMTTKYLHASLEYSAEANHGSSIVIHLEIFEVLNKFATVI